MSGVVGAGGGGPPSTPLRSNTFRADHPHPRWVWRGGFGAGARRIDDVVMTDEREQRRAELRERLAAVRGRIEKACRAVGRDPDEVTLVAITKTFPASDVRLLYGLGVRDVGENRDQEAAPKAAECADLEPQLTWHFVGQLQTNKAGSVVRYASVVHSVDRDHLVRV